MRCRLRPIKSIIGLAAALALPAFHAVWAQTAGPLFPQASPPTIQLAAAPENKFDGEWRGTFVGKSGCDTWKFPIEATIKDGELSTVVKGDKYQNEIEASVSNDGRLSFWDRFEYLSTWEDDEVKKDPIKITGKFTNNEFQGEFSINDSIGGCFGEILLTRLGSFAHKKLTASREDLIAELQAQSRDLKNQAIQDPEEAAHLTKLREAQRKEAKQLSKLKGEAEQRFAKEEARFAKLREEQRKEAQRVAKQRAEEEARLAKLREEQRQEAERLAKMKAEAEERAMQFAALAEKQASARKKVIQSPIAGINFGDYQALVIGIAEYKYLPRLETAVFDAMAVARVLKEDYGFKVTTLIDPDHITIIDSLDEYRETLGPDDNLLIYYAGHGWLDEDADRGYWLPVDAKPNRRSRWVSNATITDTLKALNAKHVMLVADSCYSGTLVRGVDMEERKREGDYWKKMASKWARVAITSGGLEPVADKGGGKNSPFAKAFLDALGDNDLIMDGTQLFTKLRRPVMVAAQQTPQYADVRQAGHDGGDFLFVRKK